MRLLARAMGCALVVGLLSVLPMPHSAAVGPDDGRADVYAFVKNDQGKTAVHILDATGNYQAFTLETLTALGEPTGSMWQRGIADFNGDGTSDIYAIHRDNGGYTTVHVLNGATNFQTFLLQTLTVLPATTDPRWELRVGDFNADGRADVYAIDKVGSGMTDVHILDAATNFQTFLLETQTALHATNTSLWDVQVGDYDGDGRADVYAMNKDDQDTTAVHVLDADSNFSVFSIHTTTAMHLTTDPWWVLRVGDYDGDGRSDLFAFNRNSNGHTDAHVIDASGVMTASGNFQSFSLHINTPLPVTYSDAWDLQVTSTTYVDGKRDDGPEVADPTIALSALAKPVSPNDSGWSVGSTTLAGAQPPVWTAGSPTSGPFPACATNASNKYKLVRSYFRAWLHVRMNGATATLRCGKFSSGGGETKFGFNHILDRHMDEYEWMSGFVGQNWRDALNWTLFWTIGDPDIVIDYSNGKRFCYERVIEIRRLSSNTRIEKVRSIVVLGETGIRVMTAFLRDPDLGEYCTRMTNGITVLYQAPRVV